MTISADAIVALVAFAALLLIFYRPWQEAITDLARQCVFEERDAIFDMAMCGKLDFASSEYQTIRSSLNRLIRFGHELNWVRFSLFVVKLKNDGATDTPSALRVAISKISDPSIQEEVREHVAKAHSAMIGMLLLKSIFIFVPCIALLIVLYPVGKVRQYVRGLSAFNTLGERVQIEAERAC